MNRKTFLASLAGLVAAPLLAKVKPVKAVQECAANGGLIKGVMFVNKTDLSIIERCEAIRRETELLAGQTYAFTQGRIHGSLDFIKESSIDDAIVIQDELNKRIFDELSKTD